MESEIKDLREDIKKLMIDVALIRRALISEKELTPWAEKELMIAREENEDKYTSLEEL